MSSISGKKKPHSGGTFTGGGFQIGKIYNINVCKIKLFEYDHHETWNEVLNDLFDGQNLNMHKTCLSDKITGTVTFIPDMKEPIRLVKV